MPGRGLAAFPVLDFAPVAVDFGQTTQTFHVGKGAAAVPGELVGLLELHRRAGRLSLAEVVAPAVAWARDGFMVSPQIARIAAVITPIVSRSPAVARLFFPGEHMLQAGDRLANPDLGDFLHALGEGNPAVQVAQYWSSLVDHFGPAHGVLITAADVAAYAPVIREPLRVEFGRHTVWTNPPPSAGGGLVGAGLRIVAGLGLGQEAFLGREHQLAMAVLLATVSVLRQSGYDERLRSDPASIRDLVAGDGMPAWVARARSRRRENPLGATTHVSVIDAEGMAAAMTTSNGEGCGETLPGLGIHVNNFLGEDDINPGGFHQLAPGSWMSTMMSPTIVVAGERPCFALGSGGSNRIRSAILQALLNLLAYRRPLDEAVNAARLHVEGHSSGSKTSVSTPTPWRPCAPPGPTPCVSNDAPSLFFGGVNCAASLDGQFAGAGDRRRGGVVVIAED